MATQQNTWAIVLAAGDGTRLASLTTDDRGNAVPKQFCSLNGGPSLLHAALRRARRIVPRGRVCAIVAQQHERYWRSARWSLPARNVFIEPHNSGTAIGVLHGVLRILDRDPLARIVFLPADHHVSCERLLADTVRTAVTLLSRGHKELLLIGIAPDELDPELGYIVPGATADESCRGVALFVEKPTTALASDLIARGAVWNSFIFAAHASTLLALLRARMPEIVHGMTMALVRDRRQGRGTAALDEFYEGLPTIDFSRSVVQDAAPVLRVLTAPACGWTDLGTPRRVARVIERLRRGASRRRGVAAKPRPVSAFINLSAQYARLLAAS